MRSRSSPWSPGISAREMSRAITPTATPRTEISEISEMKACFRRASRYRSATNNSKVVIASVASGPHQGEQDDVTDRGTFRGEHHHPIDPHGLASRRRQPGLEGGEG